MKVTDAARLLGAGAKELIEKIAGTREGTQDALAELRKLEEQLTAKEQKEREEAERVRAEQERIREEQARIAAANAQEEALRAAVLAEHERAKREAGEQAPQRPAAETPAAEAPKQAEPQRPAEAPRQPRPQQGAPGPRAQQGQQRGPRQPYAPRPFVPNPNDPNALVNRQNPRFAGQQQGAQHNGDDDFDRIRDVEIAALVGERHTGPKREAVRFAADAAGKLLHGNTSCKCDIGFGYGYGRSGPADRLEQAVFVGAGPVRIRFRLLAQKPPEPAPPHIFAVRRTIFFLRHGFLLYRR